MRNIWTTTGKCFLINYFVEVIQKFHLFYSNMWLLTLPLPKRPNCILNQKRGKILWNWNLTLRRNWKDGPFKSRVRISVDPFTSSQGAKCAPPPQKCALLLKFSIIVCFFLFEYYLWWKFQKNLAIFVGVRFQLAWGCKDTISALPEKPNWVLNPKAVGVSFR